MIVENFPIFYKILLQADSIFQRLSIERFVHLSGFYDNTVKREKAKQ